MFSHSVVWWHEEAQTFAMDDYVLEMIGKKLCKCDRYEFFKHLILFVVAVVVVSFVLVCIFLSLYSLQNLEMKIDFPFRVTDREHAVINLQSRAPILLLGRSGTGKTTCCLYRLWSRFLTYWTKARDMDYCPWLPRAVQYTAEEFSGEKRRGGVRGGRM